MNDNHLCLRNETVQGQELSDESLTWVHGGLGIGGMDLYKMLTSGLSHSGFSNIPNPWLPSSESPNPESSNS